jgi:hypothetical protein
MHAARFGGKWRKRVRAVAKPQPDALCLAEVTELQAALLALVSQTTTLSAGKNFAAEVQHCHPPPTVSSIDPRAADEPWTPAAKMTGGPSNGQTLASILHFAQEMTRAVTPGPPIDGDIAATVRRETVSTQYAQASRAPTQSAASVLG